MFSAVFLCVNSDPLIMNDKQNTNFIVEFHEFHRDDTKNFKKGHKIYKITSSSHRHQQRILLE
jgi:hypothetical protein